MLNFSIFSLFAQKLTIRRMAVLISDQFLILDHFHSPYGCRNDTLIILNAFTAIYRKLSVDSKKSIWIFYATTSRVAIYPKKIETFRCIADTVRIHFIHLIF